MSAPWLQNYGLLAMRLLFWDCASMSKDICSHFQNNLRMHLSHNSLHMKCMCIIFVLTQIGQHCPGLCVLFPHPASIISSLFRPLLVKPRGRKTVAEPRHN